MTINEPPPSKTTDNYSHRTSPITGPQVAVPKPLKVAREMTGTPYSPKLPPHVTKHPNPVGRPKTPRG